MFINERGDWVIDMFEESATLYMTFPYYMKFGGSLRVKLAYKTRWLCIMPKNKSRCRQIVQMRPSQFIKSITLHHHNCSPYVAMLDNRI